MKVSSVLEDFVAVFEVHFDEEFLVLGVWTDLNDWCFGAVVGALGIFCLKP